MNHPIPLHYPLPHFIQTISSSQQHSLILMIPEISPYLLPLKKLHLLLHTTPHHLPITQLHKEILPHTDQLQYLKIESINIHHFPFLIDRQHILQHQPDKIRVLQVSPKIILDALYLRHRIEPESASCEEVVFDVVSYAEVVVLIAHEDCLALVDWDVALVGFGL